MTKTQSLNLVLFSEKNLIKEMKSSGLNSESLGNKCDNMSAVSIRHYTGRYRSPGQKRNYQIEKLKEMGWVLGLHWLVTTRYEKNVQFTPTNLKILMNQKRVGVEEMAVKLKVSRQVLYDIINGDSKSSFDMVKSLCKYFGVNFFL